MPPEPDRGSSFAIPLSVAIVVVAVFGTVGWLLVMGFTPGAAVGIVALTGVVAVELVRLLIGHGGGSGTAGTQAR